MKAKETMVAWTPEKGTTNPTRGEMKCGPWPDTTGWSSKYNFTDLACWQKVQKMSEPELQLLCFHIAMTAIMRDGVNPLVVDVAMTEIDEYRSAWDQHPAHALFEI
jgi:hypothetical protein